MAFGRVDRIGHAIWWRVCCRDWSAEWAVENGGSQWESVDVQYLAVKRPKWMGLTAMTCQDMAKAKYPFLIIHDPEDCPSREYSCKSGTFLGKDVGNRRSYMLTCLHYMVSRFWHLNACQLDWGMRRTKSAWLGDRRNWWNEAQVPTNNWVEWKQVPSADDFHFLDFKLWFFDVL